MENRQETIGKERMLNKTETVMVRHMMKAWQAPMFGITVEIDIENAEKRRSAGITLTDIIVFECAKSLAEHPQLNAHYQDNSVFEYEAANIGLAVASKRGLTVPVIHNASKLSLEQIAQQRKNLVDKVKEGRISITEVSGGTFTISNLGMFGVSRFTALLNPPQVAILAIGSATMRHCWNGGAPSWKKIAEFTLTSDHRAVDGAAAAAFMQSLKLRLEGTSL